jgi:hypothetical protein
LLAIDLRVPSPRWCHWKLFLRIFPKTNPAQKDMTHPFRKIKKSDLSSFTQFLPGISYNRMLLPKARRSLSFQDTHC